MTTLPVPHETHVRVRYGEVDRMGFVYHAHYLVYFEQGRTEYLRALGGTYREVEDAGTLLVVVESGVRHVRPATYDDLLTVRTWLEEARGARVRFRYEVLRDADVMATGFTLLAAAGPDGRPRRIPEGFRRALEQVPLPGNGRKDRPPGPVQDAEGR